jgi:hypothetical protein
MRRAAQRLDRSRCVGLASRLDRDANSRMGGQASGDDLEASEIRCGLGKGAAGTAAQVLGL